MSGVCDPSGGAHLPGRRGAAHGTSIVPDESFSLRLGDVVTIDIPCIGTLTTRSSASAGGTRAAERANRAVASSRYGATKAATTIAGGYRLPPGPAHGSRL